MENLLNILEDNFTILVEYLILFVEFVGVLVVVGAIIKGIITAKNVTEIAYTKVLIKI